MRLRSTLFALIGTAVLASSGALTVAQTPGFSPVTDATLQNPEPGDWLNWRRTLDGWGYSTLDQVDRSNVGDLRLVWSWGLDQGRSQTTPLVHDGVMYIANPGNVVQALDARTGNFMWEHRPQLEEGLRAYSQTRSLAIYEDLILLNTADAHVVALDARTGDVRWDTPIMPDQEGYGFSSGPIVADGVIVSGLRGCAMYREDTCYIVGIDGRTGQLLWKTSTVAKPGERGGDTWGDLPLLFRAGGDAWIPGSYDPVTKMIYYGTSQPKPWTRDARRTDGDALYTNSTLALDPTTGEMQCTSSMFRVTATIWTRRSSESWSISTASSQCSAWASSASCGSWTASPVSSEARSISVTRTSWMSTP